VVASSYSLLSSHLDCSERGKRDFYYDKQVERGKRDFYCDKQVEMGSNSSQLCAKGFMGRRRK